MKTFTRFLLLAAFVSPRMFGGVDCVLPPMLCERLNPGMAVFIGKQMSKTTDQYGVPTVAFEIQELLWGSLNTRVATVFFSDGYQDSNQPQFLAVTPTEMGTTGTTIAAAVFF